MKAITARLKIMRLERNRMTQREVAAKAGISPLRYWEIENGHREPESHDLRGLAKAFRCTQAEIVGEPESVAS